MKLEQVTIENFRQYLGKQESLFFSGTKEKNVTLIYGMNGSGKSNLFKAINWCIYGNSVLKEDGAELINKEAIKRAGENDIIETKVVVTFFHRGEKFVLQRSIEYFKKNNSYGNEDFTMRNLLTGGLTKKVENPIGRINDILPENVRTYFLFDGEKIDNFSKPSSAADVRNAIYNVLKLEVLERGKEHLRSVSEEFQKELRKVAGTLLQELLDEYEEKKKKEVTLEKRQKELDKELELAKNKIKEIDLVLEGLKESRELQKERERLEADRSKQERELNDCIESIRRIATSSLAGINTAMLKKAITFLDSKRKKGEIPSNIRQQFLQDVIDKGLCICGRPFKLHDDAYTHLLQMQGNSISGMLEEEVITLSGSLLAIQAETESNMGYLNGFMQRQADLRDNLDEIDTEISEVSQKLKGSRSEDVEKLEKQREKFKADESSYNIEKGANSTKLESLAEQLKDLDLQIKKTQKDKEEEKGLSNKRAIALKAANAIDDIYQKFADNMRAQIETSTKEIFDQLIWKDSQFKHVQLGKDYHLEIIDRWDRPASSELSAGERQILSLSFITAMARESGGEAPMVMDTPFGRLSKTHRENIILNIPALSHQLVLFITDEEMSEQMLRNLQHRIGETYYLNFDDETGCTTIERK